MAREQNKTPQSQITIWREKDEQNIISQIHVVYRNASRSSQIAKDAIRKSLKWGWSVAKIQQVFNPDY